jgi:glycosyltransferase involved in cell wall biosynthesis
MTPRKTFGIAVPTYAKHLQHLEALLDSISASSVLPDLVSISCSSMDRMLFLKRYPFEIVLSITPEYRNPSQNRNVAAQHADVDIISFVDGDDLVHPARTGLLREAFERGSQIACHNYCRGEVYVKGMFEETGALSLRPGYINISPPNAAFPHNDKVHLDYHCAHVTMLKPIYEEFRYNEDEKIKYSEDAELLRRIVTSGRSIDYIDNKLSFYRK